MGIITLDFETYYDSKGYSLNRTDTTTEAYINDWRFEIILVAVKQDREKTNWYTGTHEEIKKELEKYDWENNYLLAHNTKFDGAVLNWKFGIKPKYYLDTLSMAQAVLHTCTGKQEGSLLKNLKLKSLVQFFELGKKGTEVHDADKKNRIDFSTAELKSYADYCVNDVELTYDLFWKIFTIYWYPDRELDLINNTLNMFIHPKFELDLEALEEERERINIHRNDLLVKAGVPKQVLTSPQKFKTLLAKHGITPPDSLKKDNHEFTDLLYHEKEVVRNLVEARLCFASSIEPSRIEKLIESANRNNGLHVPLKYYGAHTGRWSGTDKINLQNITRNAKGLKKCFKAPPGHVVINSDLSQIETRLLCYFAGQEDMVENFRAGKDVYKEMASKIYRKDIDEITKEQRQVGKTAVLGCGYGMGKDKFHTALMKDGVFIPKGEARSILSVYRNSVPRIQNLWSECKDYLANRVWYNKVTPIGRKGMVEPIEEGIRLPNGMVIFYMDLTSKPSEEFGHQFFYCNNGTFNKKIWHGTLAENIVQALARIIIGDQINAIAKRYQVALTIHDSIICIVPEAEQDEAVEFMRKVMTTAPEWAKDVPLNCEIEVGKNYGELAEVKETVNA